jgi:hypothetical protein
MFLHKVKRRESGILLYGITPPKEQTPGDRIAEIAQRVIQTVGPLGIDALVVYDVQDESARTTEDRPFPFVSSIDPFHYASQHLHGLPVPKIIYRPAGKYSIEELSLWLLGMRTNGFFPVFVGLPTPDYVVKTSLKEAYDLWRKHLTDQCLVGAVTIPERHVILKDEDVRMLDKMDSGVSFFISQCIFNSGITKETLKALVKACEKSQKPVPTVIFTLTLCGSVKTLSFLDWLGIHVPDDMKAELISCDSPVRRSVEITTAIAKDLIGFCVDNSIPFGFNVESVSIRKEEVNASLELFNTIDGILKANGLRLEKRPSVTALSS